MVTVEEKLNLFSKHVFERVQKEYDEKLKEIQEYNHKVMEEHREKIIQEGKNFIIKKIKDQKNKSRQMISKAQIEVNKDILIRKKEKLEELILHIKQRLSQFTEEKGYEEYLMKIFSQSLTQLEYQNHLEIHMTQRDLSRFQQSIEKVLKEMGWSKEQITMVSAVEDIIGGMMVVDMDKGMSLDATLATKIEDNKSFMGAMLYKELEKAGEKNESI